MDFLFVSVGTKWGPHMIKHNMVMLMPFRHSAYLHLGLGSAHSYGIVYEQ